MTIPNTKRHPNNTKTDKLPILRKLPAFQGRTTKHYIAHPDEPRMHKYGKFGEIPVPLTTRTRVEDAAPQNPLPCL